MVDVVSPMWFADRLDDVRVMDVRDDWEPDGIGHLPGAVSILFGRFRSTDGNVGMPLGRDVQTSLLSGASAAADNGVVTYDNTYGVFVAHSLVTVFLCGHDPDRLRLLNGDFSAQSHKRETITEMNEVAETVYETTGLVETLLVDSGAVEAVFDNPGTIIVGIRDPTEYDEGHLPGTINLNRHELADDEMRGLKPRDELDVILDAVGITPGRRTVLYCSTARRISHTYVIPSHLGYNDVAFYKDSLTEWEERDDAVVENRRARLWLTRVDRVAHGLVALAAVTTHVIDA